MTQIDAFVGHSFTEEDADVVGKFAKYFDQLKLSLPNFSWDHAEAAEPKPLADKVLALIEGKNLFIGICTIKERVAPTSLRPSLLRPSYLMASDREFLWKTSDWIIQEIGLAMGKGLSILLLLEAGVREPGGLQSDIEYISFDRAAPERSFGKILEMIGALSPRTAAGTAIVASASGTTEADRDQAEPEELEEPLPTWDRRKYELALFHMIMRDDELGATRIGRAYLATEEAQREDNETSWKAYREYTRLRFGKSGSFAALEALADSHPQSSKTLVFLARWFEEYEDHKCPSSELLGQRAASFKGGSGSSVW